MIQTNRVAIRELEMDDLDAVHQLLDRDLKMDNLSREERARWLEWTILSYEQHKRLYQPPHGEFALVLKDNDLLIGAVGFAPSRIPLGMLPSGGAYHDPNTGRKIIPQIGLFYAVATQYQKCGYASEAAKAMIDYAFNEMGYKRIVATTEYDNHASQAVMRKLGMTLERNPYEEMPWFQIVGILENE